MSWVILSCLNLSSAVAKFFILAMSDPFAFSSSKMTLIGLGLSESTSFLPSLVTFFTVCLFVPVILHNSFTDQDGTLTSQLEEFKESMARKSNIIIFRAEESKKTEPKERK
jgi:hypothetical protein